MVDVDAPPKTFPFYIEGLWLQLQTRYLLISPPTQLPDGRFCAVAHLKEVVYILVLFIVVVGELNFLDFIKHELSPITPQKVLCHP